MTNDIMCGYTGDREATLMAYLYDDITAADRTAFDQHLTTCARCRSELNGLEHVRAQLARWSAPDLSLAPQSRRPSFVNEPPAAQPRRAAWSFPRGVPAWAQVAAALLVLGVAAGIANLDVRYDGNGLTIRTGWSKPASSSNLANPVNPADSANVANRASLATPARPWQADLAALDQRLEQLRSEIRAAQASAPSGGAAARASSLADAELMRRVKSLVDESARRQQSELALRVAEVVRDMNVQRQADLRKIDQNLGLFQDKTGVEVLRNRQKLDYILQRVSQQPQQ